MSINQRLKGILSMGITGDETADVINNIRSVNQAALAGAIICTLILPIAASISVTLGLALFSILLRDVLILASNRRGQPFLGRLISIYGTIVSLNLLILVLGSGMGAQFLMLIPIALALEHFQTSERVHRQVVLGFSIFSFGVWSYLDFYAPRAGHYDPDFTPLVRGLFYGGVFISLVSRFSRHYLSKFSVSSHLEVGDGWRSALLQGKRGLSFVLSSEGAITFSSQGVPAPWGERLEDVLWTGLPPREMEILKRGFESALEGEAKSIEIPVVLNQAERTSWFRLYLHRVGRRGGVGVVVVVEETTERHDLVTALGHSEARLTALIENIDGSIWSVDRQRCLLAANSVFQQSMEQQIGRPMAIGENVLEGGWDKGVYDFWQAKYQAVLDSGRQVFELESPPEDGRTRTMEISLNPILDQLGAVVGLTGVTRDISERKESLKRVQASERRFRSLFEGTSEAVFLMDGSIITDANAALLSLFGVKEAQAFVGLSLKRFFGWEGEEGSEECLALESAYEALQVRGHHAFKGTIRPRGAAEFVGSIRLTQVRVEDAIVVQGIIQDITLQQAREQSLLQSKNQAEAEVKAKSQFLATMSHEIRTPMNGVLGMARLLKQTNLSEVQRDYADTIVGSAEALLTVINDILDFSKIEAEKLRFHPESVDPVDLIEQALVVVAEAAYGKGLELELEVDKGAPPLINADPHRLRQILLNLLGNAVKFTEAGFVRVSLSCPQPDLMHVSVKDTGRGISKESQSSVFSAFSQVDGSLSRSFEGTGLGLSITQRLVEGMGGSIGLESEVGEGSRFYFSLPTNLDSQVAPIPETRWLKGVRLLLVSRDRKETDPHPLEKRLRQWGADVAFLSIDAVSQGGFDAGRRLFFDIPSKGEEHPMAWAIAKEMAARSQVPPLVLSWDQEGAPDDSLMVHLRKPLRRDQLFGALLRKGPGGAPLEQRIGAETIAAATRSEVEYEASLKATLMSLGALHCLIVDDNEINRRIARIVMESVGFEVVLARGGGEALELLGKETFDLCLLDIQMPDIDGIEVLRLLRLHERGVGGDVRLPVIALTAMAIKGDRELCLSSGADGYVAKPMTHSKLYREILSVFGVTMLIPGEALPFEDKGGPREEGAPEPAGSPSPALSLDEQSRGGEPDEASQRSLVSPLDEEILEELKELERTANQIGFLSRLLGSFIDSLPARREELETALGQGDIEGLKRISHTLKGSAGNIGAAALSLQAQAFEGAIRQLNGVVVGSMEASLREPFTQLMVEIDGAEVALRAYAEGL